MKKYFLWVLNCVFMSNITAQKIIKQEGLETHLQQTLEKYVAEFNVKGASACVIFDDNSAWLGTAGVSVGSDSITSNMAFGIGSNTKMYVAATLLKMQEDSLLSLDDSLHTFLKSYPNIDSNITIRELLNHTSGIFNYTNSTAFVNDVNANLNHIFTPEEVLSYVEESLFDVGSSWSYSNTNYFLAGMIIDTLTGNKVSEEIRNRILTSLNLDSTFFEIEESSDLLEPNFWQQGINHSWVSPNAIYSSAYAAGAMKSTAKDLAIFNKKLIEGDLLTNQSKQELHTYINNFYGLGIIKYNRLGGTQFGHGGNILGYSSESFYDTVHKVAIVVLTNQTEAFSDKIALELLYELKNYEPNSIAKIDNKNVVVYPNPTKSYIYVESNQPFFYQIKDMQGRIVEGGFYENRIDVRHLQEGMYLLQCVNDNRVEVFKIKVSTF